MAQAQPTDSGAAQTLANDGLALHQAGQLDAAAERYAAALAADPRNFDALHMLGALCVQVGQPERGAELIAQAIQANPNVAAAYANLGNALNRLGRHDDALWSCARAIALDAEHAAAHGEQALALSRLGRLSEALASYERLTELGPADAQAHFNCAVMLRALGRLEHALARFDQAVAHAPDRADAHRGRGLTLHELGRHEAALAALKRAIALQPDDAEAFYDRGNVLLGLGAALAAVASYDRAIALRPDHAEAHANRGNALSELKRHAEALASHDRAIALRPDYAEAHNNRLIALRELRRPDEALESCDRAITLKPDYAEAHNNRAGALYDLRRLDEALASCDRALTLRPDFAEAHCNRAVTLYELRRLQAAFAGLQTAIALKPDYAEAHYNMAMCRLALGDEAEGWAEYEWRWRTRQFEGAARDFAAPLWLGGEDLRGRTILLHAEQGLGDTLQFCRYARNVAALGAKVVLEVQPGLERLLSRLDGVDTVVTRGQPPPAHDFQTPLMSLPLALAAGPDGDGCPYLSADPDRAASWAVRLAGASGLSVGLCWAGGARPDQPVAHAIDLRRSLPLAAFTLLADIPGLQLYSLQKGPPAAELAEAKARGWSGPTIIDVTGELKDFADTAALVANLDLVITCDTAIAHLAGALGKPVWILNRHDACWRWLDGRDDSPWYPTARLFRQTTAGDWAPVLEAVTRELRAL